MQLRWKGYLMDSTQIDETFVQGFGFVRGTEGERRYQTCVGGGWVFSVFKGDDMACNLALPSMTRSQFIYFVQALGIANPWIPVAQQQPADMVTVLIAIPEPRTEYTDAGRVALGCYNSETEQWHEVYLEFSSGQETFEDAVVHPAYWMPKPDISHLFKNSRQVKRSPMAKITSPMRNLEGLKP